MKEIKLNIHYTSCTIEELDANDRELIEQARSATYTSYSPYSNFKVGAAVRLSNEQIVSGSNQENAAFGSGTCAERCAMFYATAQYPDEHLTAIAIAARGTDETFTQAPVSPCGLCRQALLEAQKRAGKPIRLLLYGQREVLLIKSVSDLLPIQFDSFA